MGREELVRFPHSLFFTMRHRMPHGLPSSLVLISYMVPGDYSTKDYLTEKEGMSERLQRGILPEEEVMDDVPEEEVDSPRQRDEEARPA